MCNRSCFLLSLLAAGSCLVQWPLLAGLAAVRRVHGLEAAETEVFLGARTVTALVAAAMVTVAGETVKIMMKI